MVRNAVFADTLFMVVGKGNIVTTLYEGNILSIYYHKHKPYWPQQELTFCRLYSKTSKQFKS